MPANVSTLPQATGLKDLVDRGAGVVRVTFSAVAAGNPAGEAFHCLSACNGAAQNLAVSLVSAPTAWDIAEETLHANA